MSMGEDSDDLRLMIDGEWMLLTKEFIHMHPGGSVINHYRDADATQVFHAFHEGSSKAYKQLNFVRKRYIQSAAIVKSHTAGDSSLTDLNISNYDIPASQEKRIVENFIALREELRTKGLFECHPWYYIYKNTEATAILLLALLLQYFGWYLTSASVLAIGWQQFGWLTHDYCHQQPSKDRESNNKISLILGNIVQGYSRNWWKEKHNTHHAVTNIIGQDSDIDMAPLLAFVPGDLKKYEDLFQKVFYRIIPYQHLYFTFVLPFLRFSWAVQSIRFVIEAAQSQYIEHVKHAAAEQIGLILHWIWVITQLWLLPTTAIRILYFSISQLGAGFLIAHVVAYSHNSVSKFRSRSRLLNNFPCLQILTTRNMYPSPVVDWFWGGLNYQIEHHLFPTLPRCNLKTVSIMVKKFCVDNDLPYMVDDYRTGYSMILKQLEKIATVATKLAPTS